MTDGGMIPVEIIANRGCFESEVSSHKNHCSHPWNDYKFSPNISHNGSWCDAEFLGYYFNDLVY